MDAPPPVKILLRSPEITLKGRNKGRFWSQLRINVRHVLHREGLPWRVRRVRGRLTVDANHCSETSLRTAMDTLRRVAGVSSVAAAVELPRAEALGCDGRIDRARFEAIVLRLARDSYRPGHSFAVRVHRVDKTFPMLSAELEGWLGQLIRDRTDWDIVRLTRPDQAFHIDVYDDSLFFHTERAKGIGGLPVGSSGSVLSLLSGGIDSPVASYLMARRGCKVDWVHMSATCLTRQSLADSQPDLLARQLSRYSLSSRLFVVPYTHFDLALSGRETGFEAVLFRRFLFRVAQSLARRTRALALVTGDSLAQVASQTIENLIATDEAVSAPVLRPLIGFDKQEIMDLGNRIGTYPISIQPHKDCCALYARGARPRSRDKFLTSIERELLPDYGAVIESSLAEMVWAFYSGGARLVTRVGPFPAWDAEAVRPARPGTRRHSAR